jgi:tRNA U34 5-methylaminomethyl-2-thiouridine-forming methyltransferase MnmC
MTIEISPPEGHRFVETEDGSWTLFSEAFQEACHSTTGARAETLLHYIQGCRILEKAKIHSPLVVLEIGFGLGIGLLTTLEELPEGTKLHFLSVELDRNLLEWFRAQTKNHPVLKDLHWESDNLKVKTDTIEITILAGNARQTLPAFVEKNPVEWHAIYQDAFSPKRNPILWTKEWFTFLKEHSHPLVTLSTYSASNSIRKGLFESGWKIRKGEKFGPKRTSTRADLCGETDPEILALLERSPVSALSDRHIQEKLTE